jgi:large subunit ribosomal protein L10
MAKVAEYKKKVVKRMIDLINQYPIIAAINMENLPAPQLQKMQAELRGRVVMIMTKRRLIKIAIEEAKKTKKGIEQIVPHLEGMPALMFSKENPFKLYKILQKSKSPAPAKANQIAPKDLSIPAGPTPFAPGPVIGELAMAGIKAGVEGGKVAIKEDSVVAKKGEKIKAKVAEILTRLGVEPMEVGLDLIAAYEDGTIYTKDILAIDETEFMNKLQSAASGAFNVAVFVSYPTKNTIEHLISKASNDAKALGLSQNIIDKEMIDALVGKAEGSMLSLKDTANIEVTAKPKEEKTAEEPQKEPEKPKEPIKKESLPEKPIEKEEIKKEPEKPQASKPEPKKEEPKPEVKEEPKPQATKPTPIEQKEIKVLEEEKEIIKEEKQLETQKPAELPVEKEVQEAVKEEEEKQLEKERIDKEKEFEKIEKQKEKPATTDDKVAEMVAKMKKFKKQPSASQLVEEVKEEVKIKEEIKKEPKQEKVPSVQELTERKNKEEKKNDMASAEQLLEKLKKKGTLRE